MMQRIFRLSICLLVLGVLSTVGQSSNAAELRTWTDSSGKHKIEAEFVRFNENKVTLKKEDGKRITLVLSKLSDEDQDLK